jgi:UPF0271 protein
MPRIDLNCDLGEGTGHDAALMPFITSANIACGGHAGDEATMQAAVDLARRHGVAVGAHPGFVDRENFGRTEPAVWPEEVFQLVLTQTRALQRIARARGATVTHVKPHGALYNMAARNTLLAAAVAQAVYEVDPRLRLFGLAGSHSLAAARSCGLEVASEVFADRTYQPDGTLTPRARADALISDEGRVLEQALSMARDGRVRATDGTEVAVQADTVCLHGDGPNAVALATCLRAGLEAAGIEVRNFSHPQS